MTTNWQQPLAVPADLRQRVLAAAHLARAAGRCVPEVPAISPVAAFSRAADALYGLLCALPDAQWRTPVLRGLDVQGLVGHLIGVEDDLQRCLAGDDTVAAADHVESTQATAAGQAGRSPAITRDEWHASVVRSCQLVADPTVIVALHGMRLRLGALLVVRAFELWTHDNDIRRVTGFPASVPDTATLHLMTDLAASMLPAAAARAGLHDSASVRLVLTGPGGGSWDVAIGADSPDGAALSIVTDAVDFCRLVANRITPADIDVHVTGEPWRVGQLLDAASTLALD